MKRVTLAVLTAILALVCLSIPTLADGPETGLIQGVVTDATGTPLPGVTVNLTGSRGAQAQVSDGNGAFRFTLLIPGAYEAVAEMESMQPAKQSVTVTAGGKVDLSLVLRLATSESITVTSEAPMVDKFNVTAGATVSSEIGQQTAGSTRTYYGVINTLPGVTSDSENANIQGSRPTINGNSWADQQVFIDGVDTSFARFGGSRVFLPTTAVTEVTMEAGGSSAEYGRKIGSTTNVIVKSGTNNFHADANISHQAVDWGADFESHDELTRRESFPKPADFLKRSVIEEDNDTTGYETSVGGPLRRDKAWFFLGWSRFDDNNVDKTLNLDPVDASLKTEARIAKINFQPGASHQLAVSWIDTPASRVYFNPESNDYWTPTPHVVNGTLFSGTWNYSISSGFFLETKAASQTSDENKFLACGSPDEAVCLAAKQADLGPDGVGAPGEPFGGLRFPANPAAGPHWPGNNYRVYIDRNNDSAWNNGWILDNGYGLNEFPRDQFNSALTQFVGTKHELKYGVDWQNVEWLSDIRRPGLYSGNNFDAFSPFGYKGAGTNLGLGTCGLARLNPTTVAQLNAAGLGALFGQTLRQAEFCLFRDYNAAFLQPLRGSGDSENTDLALYVRDRFTVGDHWTFNLGLRYENAEGKNDVKRVVFEDQHVAPRLAVSYDLKGDGRQLVSLNVGRYYAQLNQQWTNEHLQDKWGGYEEFQDYLFCDVVDVALGVCRSVGYNFVSNRIVPGRMWQLVDQGLWNSDIKPYYKDEVILGFEWQFSRNWALDAKGIWWKLDNLIGAVTQLGPNGEQFKLVANYQDFPSIIGALEAARLANGLRQPNGQPAVLQSTLDNFEEGKTEYQALQLQLNRRFANGFAVYNNVTFSELQSTGTGAWWNNTNSDYGESLHVLLTQGMIDQCNGQQALRAVPADCNSLQRYIGQPVSTINRYGNARVDKPVIWNTFGFKTWNVGQQDFTLGGHLNVASGEPWNRTEGVGTFVLSGNTAQDGGVTLQVEQEGSRRLETTYSLNLSGAWGFPMGGRLRGNVRIEALNVTDQQELVHVTSRGEPRAVRRDFQQPRSARALFSVKF